MKPGKSQAKKVSSIYQSQEDIHGQRLSSLDSVSKMPECNVKKVVFLRLKLPNGSTYTSHLSVKELKRNTSPCTKNYHFKQAQSAAVYRRPKASRIPRKLTPEMISLVTDGLKKYWSPQQICGRLLLEGGPLISHESIYKLI